MAVGNIGIDGGVEGGNKPPAGPHAGDRVEQRHPIVLCGGKRGIRSLRVVARTVVRCAPPRLDQLVMQEKSLQRTAEFRRLLELGLAPGNRVIVGHQHFAGAIDENMRAPPAVGAGEIGEIFIFRIGIDVVGKGAVSVIRPAGVVDHEIPRQRRIGIVVIGARYRLPQMGGKIVAEALLGEQARQRLARGQAGALADPVGKAGWQTGERRPEIPGRIHAAHQAHGLFDRRAGKAQSLGIEGAGAHVLDEIRRPEVARLALRAYGGVRGADQRRARQPGRDDGVANRQAGAHASNPEIEILLSLSTRVLPSGAAPFRRAAQSGNE